MLFYDSRGVNRWVVFESTIREAITSLGSSGYTSFVITPKGLYVFGGSGGVGKTDIKVSSVGVDAPEDCVGNRWDCWAQGYNCQVEKLENIYLGQIASPGVSIFRSAAQNVKITWGAEQELAGLLSPQLLMKLVNDRSITSPTVPIDLNIKRKPSYKRPKTK